MSSIQNIENIEINGYYHICTIFNWKEIFTEQIKAIENSGLLEASHHVFLVILGDRSMVLKHVETLIPDKEKREKFVVRYSSTSPWEFERPILNFLLEDCKKKEQLVWYIHSKGVSNKHQNPIMQKRVGDWRRYMQHFIVWNYKQCVDALSQENIDACGVNYYGPPSIPHFSGNFWWSKSSYIRTLSPLAKQGDYLEPEMWLCSNKPRVKCFFRSETNHYESDFPADRYIKKLK